MSQTARENPDIGSEPDSVKTLLVTEVWSKPKIATHFPPRLVRFLGKLWRRLFLLRLLISQVCRIDIL